MKAIAARILYATLCALLVFTAIQPAVPVRADAVLYASPGGLTSGDCLSWGPACELYYVLGDVAVSGDEIWVQQGTYTPTSDTDRTAWFQLEDGVGVYGGFDGTEILQDQRDPGSNVTILSGDIGTTGDSSDNSYHVVYGGNLDSTAVLDGFTISGGNDNVMSSGGGGMRLMNSSPTLTSLVFSGNYSNQGGGLYLNGSTPVLDRNIISRNAASTAGGVHLQSSNALLSGNTISANLAQYGGGLYIFGSTSKLVGNLVLANIATSQCRGLCLNVTQDTLTNNVVADNQAPNGGSGLLVIWCEASVIP